MDARLARGVLDQALGVLGVLEHLQEALALDEDELGRPERVEADEGRARAREVGEVAARVGEHPLLVGLLGPGRQQDQAQALGRRAAQPPRDLQQHGDAGQVVVGPRHDRLAGHVRHHRGGAGAEAGAQPREPARAGRGAERDQRRPGGDEAHQRRPAVHALQQPGQLVAEQPRHRLVEDRVRAGRVVVGVDDEHRVGVAVAQLADDVGRVAAGQQPPHPAAFAAGQVQVHRDGGCGAHGRAGRPPSPASSPSGV
ncbi:MAG: hypothetical protein HZB46_04290 [Solirubrobacterales bacterium]|nr:hypothetical protein [Solirubrobacterales bacterium]